MTSLPSRPSLGQCHYYPARYSVAKPCSYPCLHDSPNRTYGWKADEILDVPNPAGYTSPTSYSPIRDRLCRWWCTCSPRTSTSGCLCCFASRPSAEARAPAFSAGDDAAGPTGKDALVLIIRLGKIIFAPCGSAAVHLQRQSRRTRCVMKCVRGVGPHPTKMHFGVWVTKSWFRLMPAKIRSRSLFSVWVCSSKRGSALGL